jgi:tetratricopeptide (TPR) repeat protein
VIRDDIYDKLVKAIPPEKWGVDITPLKISDHRPLPTAENMSAKEWFEKGRVHYLAGQIDMAKECVDRMTQTYPDYASGWNLAGVVYKHLGRDWGYETERGDPKVLELYGKAVECLNRALEIEPTMVRAWKNLGSVYDELKYKTDDKSEERSFEERATECYRKALELDKSDDTYIDMLKHVHEDEKSALLEKWAAEVPPSPHPLGVMGESYYSEDEYEKAIDLLSRSIAIRPTGMSYYYLAYSYLHTGELDKMEDIIGKFTPDLIGYDYRQIMSNGYLDELKGRLRSARKKLEWEASPPEPKVFERTKLFDALEKRYNELWESLNDIPAELMQMLKVKPDDLRNAFASIDDDAVVASYRDDLEETLSRFEDEDKRGALILEWYYDGPEDFHGDTMGALSHECHAEDNDDPDQEPALSYEEEVYGFDVGEAIGIWSADLCEKYLSNEDDIPEKFANLYSTIEYTYHEIAEFRLFMIAAKAYALVTDTKPPYFFLGTHEDTPHMIVSPGKKRSKK